MHKKCVYVSASFGGRFVDKKGRGQIGDKKGRGQIGDKKVAGWAVAGAGVAPSGYQPYRLADTVCEMAWLSRAGGAKMHFT